jgi:EmrB/QacA subfamily drug resistance transporter
VSSVDRAGARSAAATARLEREMVPRHAWVALTLCSVSALMVGMSVTGLNLLFEDIGKEYHASRSTLSWSLSGYSIALAALLLVGGRMADRLGRLKVFRAGLAVFTLASLATAAAPNVALFTTARLGQAVGAALLSPASLALILPEFPMSRHNTAVAGWSAMGYLGNATAPSFTALVGEASWRYLFVFFAVVTGIVWLLAPKLLPNRPPQPPKGRVDYVGVPVGALGVGLLALAIVEGPTLGWSDPLVIAGAVGAVVLLPYFVFRSLRHPEPLLDLRIFKARAVWSANLGNVFLSAAGIAIWLVYALFLHEEWGWSVLKTGVAMTPSPAFAGITAIIGARLAERYGARKVIEFGSLLPLAGTAWLTWRLGPESNYFIDFLPGGLMFAGGFGFTFAPLNAAALRGVPREMLGQANAAFNTSRQLAGGLGTAAIVVILGNGVISMSSFKIAFAVNAGLALACAVVIALFYPRDNDHTR